LKWQSGAACQPLTDVLIAGKVILATPAVEGETLGPTRSAAPNDDRTGVAQPDVSEWLDEDLRERRNSKCTFGGPIVRGDEQDLLALAARMDSFSEGSDLLLGGLKVPKPQLRVAWKTDPNGLVGCPFGRRR
jgi:hypothetical protein